MGFQVVVPGSDRGGADQLRTRRPVHRRGPLFPQQIGWQDGFAFAHDTPGLGVEMDLDVAAASPLTPRDWPPRLYREDGTFTNW